MNAEIHTTVPAVPETVQRKLAEDADVAIEHPGLARADSAVSAEHPNGTPGHPVNRTVLQQHVDFFDRNKDGVITMPETYQGFRALGFNPLLSLLAIPVVHPGFSLATAPYYLDPMLRIHIRNIHRAKHGSDTGVYDTEGRFKPQTFEELFSKWDTQGKGGLTFWELWQMTSDLKNVMDWFGWFAAKFEWTIVWLLCQRDGVVAKEDIRGVYDGSLFYRMEAEQKERQRKMWMGFQAQTELEGEPQKEKTA